MSIIAEIETVLTELKTSSEAEFAAIENDFTAAKATIESKYDNLFLAHVATITANQQAATSQVPVEQPTS